MKGLVVMLTEVQNKQNKISLPRLAKQWGGFIEGDVIVHLFFVNEHGDAMALTEGITTGLIREVPATWVEMRRQNDGLEE